MISNRGLPPLNNLKSIVIDFEKKEFKINDFDIKHCTNVEISANGGEWCISIENYDESLTLKKKFNN